MSLVRRASRARVAVAVVALVALGGCDGDRGSDTASTTTTEPAAETIRPSAKGAGDFGRIPEVVRNVETSVVAVLTDGGEGSGVVYRADGVVVTNHHVVGRASRIEVGFADGKRLPARLLASDPLSDLAALKVDRGGTPAGRFAGDLPVVGELAIAIGNPLGLENTVTAGIISGLHRAIPGAAQQAPALVDLIQTDAAISPGNSGGALVNADGEVVGINVAYLPPQVGSVSIGFAIPAATVTDVVEQLLDQGRVRHPFLGIQPAPLTPLLAERLGVERQRGVLVLAVEGSGPAERAGLRPGDIIVAVDGDDVDTVEDFLGRLRRRTPGEQIRLSVVRGPDELQISAVLGERTG
ncbi:MAG: trypsin-like peptidase domain-containing protein [Actinomycetota bacterium]